MRLTPPFFASACSPLNNRYTFAPKTVFLLSLAIPQTPLLFFTSNIFAISRLAIYVFPDFTDVTENSGFIKL